MDDKKMRAFQKPLLLSYSVKEKGQNGRQKTKQQNNTTKICHKKKRRNFPSFCFGENRQQQKTLWQKQNAERTLAKKDKIDDNKN